MSKELFDDMKCEGWPCDGACDACPIKDEHRCYECRFFEESPLIMVGSRGNCSRHNGDATNAVDKACEDFERGEE